MHTKLAKKLTLDYVEAMQVAEGMTYTGYIDKKGNKCGNGTQIWPDNTHYTGDWLDNNAHGYGTLKCPNGDTYEGE